MTDSANAVTSPVIVCPAPPLKSMVGALKALSDDAILVLSPEGITSRVADSIRNFPKVYLFLVEGFGMGLVVQKVSY